MGKAYNLGYLTGAGSGIHLAGHVLCSLPNCPYPQASVLARSWLDGLLDSISDRTILV